MIRLIALCMYVISATAADLKWNTDCETDPSNTALTVHHLDFHPNPIIFPGPLTFTIDLTVNRKIDYIFVDTELIKKTTLGPVNIVCTQNIGSCLNIDGCTILDRILNGTEVVSQELGVQIDKILYAALGHHAQCPIMPESLNITNAHLQLSPIPAALSLITNGDYSLKISLKDDPTSTDNVGCIQFDLGIRTGPSTGLLFG